jgi:hypothetical protein
MCETKAFLLYSGWSSRIACVTNAEEEFTLENENIDQVFARHISRILCSFGLF